MFVHAGAHFVVLDFINVIEAGGSLMPMAEQVRAAWPGCTRMRRTLAAIPQRLYVSGFSSGAHLGGVVLITDWQADFGLPNDIVRGARPRLGYV